LFIYLMKQAKDNARIFSFSPGGIDDSLTFMGQTVRYSLHDNRWSDDSVSSMQKNRVSFGCCVVAGKLYAVGGLVG